MDEQEISRRVNAWMADAAHRHEARTVLDLVLDHSRDPHDPATIELVVEFCGRMLADPHQVGSGVVVSSAP